MGSRKSSCLLLSQRTSRHLACQHTRGGHSWRNHPGSRYFGRWEAFDPDREEPHQGTEPLPMAPGSKR